MQWWEGTDQQVAQLFSYLVHKVLVTWQKLDNKVKFFFIANFLVDSKSLFMKLYNSVKYIFGLTFFHIKDFRDYDNLAMQSVTSALVGQLPLHRALLWT